MTAANALQRRDYNPWHYVLTYKICHFLTKNGSATRLRLTMVNLTMARDVHLIRVKLIKNRRVKPAKTK